jgi:release factor glutamine methyltransferase
VTEPADGSGTGLTAARTGDLLRDGAERLRGSGSETPRLDAELLLAHAVGVGRTAIVAHADAPVGADAARTFAAAIERRSTGEPVAYIRGIKEFHGLVFTVDRRALIPRPETERLVDLVLDEIMRRLVMGVRAPGDELRVLDVGTGSGAIAISIAADLRRRRVHPDEVMLLAVDISPDALDLARENAVGHGVGDRLRFAAADLIPPEEDRAWEMVVANLPYVRADAMASLPVATSFEPALALDGGAGGLEVIGRLLDLLPHVLADGGIAYVEIGADQGDAIVELVGARLPGWVCHVELDLAGLSRVAVIERAPG